MTQPPKGKVGYSASDHHTSFVQLDFKSMGEDGRFEGYASLFNREDLSRDVVIPGAFTDTLRERGAEGVKMLFQHDPSQPIGVWRTLEQDAKGLKCTGRLLTEVQRAHEVIALMRAGVLDGLSIGFRVVQAVRDRRKGLRYLKKVDLWEISVVTFPMQPAARIFASGTNPFAGGTPSEREFERWLTRDAGLSRRQARLLIAEGFRAMTRKLDAADTKPSETRAAQTIAAATRLLRKATDNHRKTP